MTSTQTVTIVNKLGLHARAATKLAQLSQQYDAKVVITVDGKSADANSIMALMLLAGAQGKQAIISGTGSQAEQAVKAIATLFSNRFDEDE